MTRLLIIHIVDRETKHLQAFPTALFPQRRGTAALCRSGRTGKRSRTLRDGDSCRSLSPSAPHAPQEKGRVGVRLASVSSYDNIDEKEQTEVWNPLLLLRMMDDNG
jgi:hypothetical protein